MRTASKISIVIVLSICSFGFIVDSKNSLGKISFILGRQDEVNILPQDQDKWQQARLYSPVFNGDKVNTKQESRCEIKLNDFSIIRIGENSTFQLNKNLDETAGGSRLSVGKIWLNIKSLFKKEQFTVKTPTAVCSIRGTILRIEADSSTNIAVYEGAVDVGPVWGASEQLKQQQERQTKSLKPYEVPGPYEIPPPFEVTLDQWIRIVQGYQIEIRRDGKYAKRKIDEAEDQKSDWIKWNQMRDETAE